MLGKHLVLFKKWLSFENSLTPRSIHIVRPLPFKSKAATSEFAFEVAKSINEEAAQIASGMGIGFGNNFEVSKSVDVGRIHGINDLPTRDLKIAVRS